MDTKERFLEVFNFRKPDRLPRWELGFWSETVRKWGRQGLSSDTTPEKFFHSESWYNIGGDGVSQTPEMWSRKAGGMPTGRIREFAEFNLIDYSAMYEEKVIEETSKYVIFQDAHGMVKRHLRETESMTEFIKNPVETELDYTAYMKRFDPADECRYLRGFEEHLVNYSDCGIPICLNVPGFYGQARWMFGPLKTLFNFAAEPELMGDFMDRWGDFLIENSRRLLESSATVDFAIIWEDMAYKGGSLISPRQFREMILPQYGRVTKFFKKKGVGTILVDCDGDVTDLIPLFIKGGVDGMFPFEAAAGMDVRDVRKEHPGLILLGGIDKRTIAEGGEALRRELEGKLPLIKKGGYIPCCDHEVPPDVSLQNFREYMELKDRIVSEWI